MTIFDTIFFYIFSFFLIGAILSFFTVLMTTEYLPKRTKLIEKFVMKQVDKMIDNGKEFGRIDQSPLQKKIEYYALISTAVCFGICLILALIKITLENALA